MTAFHANSLGLLKLFSRLYYVEKLILKNIIWLKEHDIITKLSEIKLHRHFWSKKDIQNLMELCMYLCTYSRQQIRDFQEAPSFHVPPKNLRTEQLVINESFMVLSIYEFEKLTALPQRWQSKEEAKYGCLNNRVG